MSSLILCIGIKIEILETVTVSSLMNCHEIGLLSYRLEDSRYVSETGHGWVFWTKGRNTAGWRKLCDKCDGFSLDGGHKMGVACSIHMGN